MKMLKEDAKKALVESKKKDDGEVDFVTQKARDFMQM